MSIFSGVIYSIIGALIGALAGVIVTTMLQPGPADTLKKKVFKLIVTFVLMVFCAYYAVINQPIRISAIPFLIPRSPTEWFALLFTPTDASESAKTIAPIATSYPPYTAPTVRTPTIPETEQAQKYAESGFHASGQGNYDLAIRYCDEAIKLDFAIYRAYDCLGSALYERGRQHNDAQDYRRALDVLERGFPLTNDYGFQSSNLMTRGDCLRWLGDLDGAVAEYDKALKFFDYSGTYLRRGIAYYRKGEHDRAIKDLTTAANSQWEAQEAYLFRGRSLAAQGKQDVATADFQRCVEVHEKYRIDQTTKECNAELLKAAT